MVLVSWSLPPCAVTGGPPSHVAGARHAYLFLLQLEEGAAFIGCTPEKLFTIKGDELSTEALAGTRPRGESVESDATLAHEVWSMFSQLSIASCRSQTCRPNLHSL